MSLEHSAPSSIEAKQLAALRSEVEAVSAWLKDAALRSEGAGLWAPGLEMRNCAGRLDKALGAETPKRGGE